MHQVETLLKTVGLTERIRHYTALDYLGTVVHAQSQTLAFQDTFMVVGGVTLLALLPAYILSRSQRRDMRASD
jgi:MFS transporter, DHA2 family, multidrug resistance protein